MGNQMNFMQIVIPVFVAAALSSGVPFYLNVLKYYYSAKWMPFFRTLKNDERVLRKMWQTKY